MYARSVSVLRRLIVAGCALSLLAVAVTATATSASSSTGASATASKKKKKCPKGYKLKTVTKHGKKVKRCRKVKGTGGSGGAGGGSGGNAPLFEPPGRKLVGNEAVPFLQRYLYDSRFTDCPAGWPNCGVVEERYSHFSDGSFYYCRLGPTPGSDIKSGPMAYQVKNAVIEADGSWTFNEAVDDYGNPAFYEWHVAVNGVVNGAYSFNGGAFEQLGPFQYVSGARDCSY
jgi:hypothetical protein